MGVNLETSLDEIVKLWRPKRRVFEALNWIGFGHENDHKRFDMRVGDLTFCQLNCSYSKGPDISLLVILAISENLRTHPIRTADVGAEPSIGIQSRG